VSVGAWWLLFSIPLFRDVPESAPPATSAPRPSLLALARRLVRTLRETRHHPDLFRFLLAYWIYSDGIGTVIRMATIYGSEIGLARTDLIGALLMLQLLAAPASLAFGRLAHRIGARTSVVLGLGGYAAIAVFGYFISKPWHFWVVAGMVALVQGGTQSLSRSMFASLVPPKRLGEMFGFYS